MCKYRWRSPSHQERLWKDAGRDRAKNRKPTSDQQLPKIRVNAFRIGCLWFRERSADSPRPPQPVCQVARWHTAAEKHTRRLRSQRVPLGDFTRTKQPARTRWQRATGGYTGIFSALEWEASREPQGREKKNPTEMCFSFIAQWGARGSRKRRRTSGKPRYLREVFEQCVCSSEKIRPSRFFKMGTVGAAEWPVHTGPHCDDDDDNNTHLATKLHTLLVLS